MPRAKIINTREYIENRSIPEPNSGCWLWLGPLDKGGYGKVSTDRDGRKVSLGAHRLAWEAYFGDPGELHVLHKCDTPACVNPTHLFTGTQGDNMHDMLLKGRHVSQSPELSDARERMWYLIATKNCLQCGREFEGTPKQQLCSKQCDNRRHKLRNRERIELVARLYAERA